MTTTNLCHGFLNSNLHNWRARSFRKYATYTIHEVSDHLEVIKNSKFYVKANHAKNIGEALIFLKSVQNEKASHNCWAYRSSTGYERFSDDGEPGGTAGRPILSAIEGEQLVDIVVVVTRIFGGIKLGTGGLVRAYGDAVRNCLKNTSKIEIFPISKIQYKIKISTLGSLHYVLGSVDSHRKISEIYDNDNAIVTIEIHEKDISPLNLKLMAVCKGQIEIIIL